jgi:hypothetical protein
MLCRSSCARRAAKDGVERAPKILILILILILAHARSRLVAMVGAAADSPHVYTANHTGGVPSSGEWT